MLETRLARRFIECWGTIITIDAPCDADSAERIGQLLDAALPGMRAEAERIDRILSTWRPDSIASALRSGARIPASLDPADPDEAEMLGVLDALERARQITCGAFDAGKAPGGFDPSGYVKGWGAGRIADTAVEYGLGDICVNAAGDIATLGRGPTGPWRIGIENPDAPASLCAILDSGDPNDLDGARGGVATSGFSRQDGHVTARGPAPAKARQATVVGPDAGLADAIATALLIDGREGAQWFAAFARTDIRGYRPVTRWGAILVEGDSLIRLGSCAEGIAAGG